MSTDAFYVRHAKLLAKDPAYYAVAKLNTLRMYAHIIHGQNRKQRVYGYIRAIKRGIIAGVLR